MKESETKVVKTEIPADQIPEGLRSHFHEYDPDRLDLEKDADLIIQRTLEFGTWEEVRWLFATVKSCIFPLATSSMPPFTLRRFTPSPMLPSDVFVAAPQLSSPRQSV